MKVEKVFFQPDKANEAIRSFMVNLLESVLIVILLLVFTMGFRSGLIIGFGLVLTVAVSFPILLSIGITLTQPLYAGGKIVAGHRLAKIGEEAAEEQCRKTRTEVIYDADNAYWTYVPVIEKQKMMNALSAQMDTLFSQVGASIDAGMAITQTRICTTDYLRATGRLVN
ncbi:MAG: TolC family protein [Candidatus Cryptobacteroides sp.]|nr:TolC family protein [Bacteroidales bacterium]